MKNIKIILLYGIYVLITLEKRMKYAAGKEKGMECTKIESGLFSDTYHYKRNPPVRDYLTWPEFKINWGYNTKSK